MPQDSTILDKWLIADRAAVAARKERRKAERDEARAARVERTWVANTQRWQMLEAAEQTEEVAKEKEAAVTEAITLANSNTLSVTQKKAAREKVGLLKKEIEEAKATAGASWQAWRLDAREFLGITTPLEENEKLSPEEKELRRADQAVNELYKSVHLAAKVEAGRETSYRSFASEQEECYRQLYIYKFELRTEREKAITKNFSNVDAIIKAALEKYHSDAAARTEAEELYRHADEAEKEALASYDAMAQKEALKAARTAVKKNIFSLAEEAWVFQTKESAKQALGARKSWQEEQATIIAPLRSTSNEFNALWRDAERKHALAQSDWKALRTFNKEAARLTDIKETWLAMIDAEKEAIKREREIAAERYFERDYDLWNGLHPDQRAAYNEAVEAANRIYHAQPTPEITTAEKKLAEARERLEKISNEFYLRNSVRVERVKAAEKVVADVESKLQKIISAQTVAKHAFIESGKLRCYAQAHATDEPTEELLDETTRLFEVAGIHFEKVVAAWNNDQLLFASLWNKVATGFHQAAIHYQQALTAWLNGESTAIEALCNNASSSSQAAERLRALFETASKLTGAQHAKTPEELEKLFLRKAKKAGIIANDAYDKALKLAPSDVGFESVWNEPIYGKALKLTPSDVDFESAWSEAIRAAQAAVAIKEQYFAMTQQLREELPETEQANWDKDVLHPAHYDKAISADRVLLCEVQKAEAITQAAYHKAQKMTPSDVDFENFWSEAIRATLATAVAAKQRFVMAQQQREELPETEQARWDKNILHPAHYYKTFVVDMLLLGKARKAETIAIAFLSKAQKLTPDDVIFERSWNEAITKLEQTAQYFTERLNFDQQLREKLPESQKADWDKIVLDHAHRFKAIWAAGPSTFEKKKAEAILNASWDKAQKMTPSDVDFESVWSEAIRATLATAVAWERCFAIDQQLRDELPKTQQTDWGEHPLHESLILSEAYQKEALAKEAQYNLRKTSPDDPNLAVAQAKAFITAQQTAEAWDRIVAYREEAKNEASEIYKAYKDTLIKKAMNQRDYWLQQAERK